MTSVAAAEKWRDENSRRGATGNRTKSAGAETGAKFSSAASAHSIEGKLEAGQSRPPLCALCAEATEKFAIKTSPAAAEIENLRELVQQAKGTIAAAETVNGRTQAVRNYVQLMDTLRRCEKEYPKILEATEGVFQVSEVQRTFYRVMLEFNRHLEQFPFRAAAELAGVPLNLKCEHCGCSSCHTIGDFEEVEKKLRRFVATLRAQLSQFPFSTAAV